MLEKENLKIIVPSNWLKNQIDDSFLKKYEVDVIYNRIDKNIFNPKPGFFKKRYGLEEFKVVLGVASTWDRRKGLDLFIELSKKLPYDYRIVIIGLSPRQIKKIGYFKNIIGFERTKSQSELVEAYSDCDVYFCSSYEETFGLTMLEAYFCGCKNIIGMNCSAVPEVLKLVKGIVLDSNGDVIEQFLDKLYYLE